jgi:uncharacterized membrane protein
MNNKAINITILVLIVLFISFRLTIACNEMSKSDQELKSDPINELPVTFTGFLPCADCPGIEYYLLVEEDGFTEISWYRDRDTGPFTESGEWFLQNDTLTIYNEDGDLLKTFLYDENRLTLLSPDKQLITGDLANMQIIEKSQEETSIRRRHNDLRDEGVDFLASGNEPFWNIRIDIDKQIQYRTPEKNLYAEVPEPVQENDALTYNAEMEEGNMLITIKKEYCRDTMSGFLFTHTVSIQLNDEQEFKGCGRYLSGN